MTAPAALCFRKLMYPEVKEVELTKDKIQKITMFLHYFLLDLVFYDFYVLLHYWEVGKLHFLKERRVKKRRFEDGILITRNLEGAARCGV
jgi:hypothetical protein